MQHLPAAPSTCLRCMVDLQLNGHFLHAGPNLVTSHRSSACNAADRTRKLALAQGFFYNRFPAPSKAGKGDLGTETDTNLGQELWYHRVGFPQAQDSLVMQIPEQPEWQSSAEVTDDGRWVWPCTLSCSLHFTAHSHAHCQCPCVLLAQGLLMCQHACIFRLERICWTQLPVMLMHRPCVCVLLSCLSRHVKLQCSRVTIVRLLVQLPTDICLSWLRANQPPVVCGPRPAASYRWSPGLLSI